MLETQLFLPHSYQEQITGLFPVAPYMLCMQKNSLDSFLGSDWKIMSGIRNRFVISVLKQVQFSSELASNHLL